MTLRRFAAGLDTTPATTVWYLADLDKESAVPAEKKTDRWDMGTNSGI
jgi:hypothetical protein